MRFSNLETIAFNIFIGMVFWIPIALGLLGLVYLLHELEVISTTKYYNYGLALSILLPNLIAIILLYIEWHLKGK